MPANVTLEYGLSERNYREAKTDQERIIALNDMLSKAPTHKGSERLRQEIKTKISKLKERIEKTSKKKGKSLGIKKEGAATIILVGLTNSGRSYVLSRLTNAKIEVSEFEYSTKKPEIGMMDYNGIKIQVIELPAIFKDYSKHSKGVYFSLIRMSDLIIVVIDGFKNLDEQLFIIEDELKKGLIGLNKDNVLVLVNKEFRRFSCGYKVVSLDNLKEEIWKKLNLIYVYTKLPGKEKDYPPVDLVRGRSVKDLAEKVHKDFIRKFRFARVWGRSVKHEGTQVGLSHILEEDDIVEFHLR